MTTKAAFIISAIMTAALGSNAMAVELLKAEPGRGKLKEGAVVFVDDGSCGKGKVKRVLGGNQAKGIGRTSSCVVAPK